MKSDKQKDKSEKWKPKHRWIESITISLKEPQKAKYKYYTPKSLEEEKMMEDEFNRKMDTIFDILFPEGIYKAMEKFRKK
jgi:hypothetical protein